MVSPGEAGFEIVQNRVDPGKLGNLIGFARAYDDSLNAKLPSKWGQLITEVKEHYRFFKCE